MMKAIQFILISTASLSILYGFYLVMYRNGINFKELRMYLLASIFISVLLPMSNYRISMDFPGNKTVNEYVSNESQGTAEKGSIISEPFVNSSSASNTVLSESWKNDLFEMIKKTYLVVLLALLFRISVHITILIVQFFMGRREKSDGYVLIYNSRLKNSFSFFNWIFLSPEFLSKRESEQIILHEKIHASQYHSFDLILIELLAAVMWFNPLVWMMRKSIQLVHEYLADEGVLNAGIDKINYQALLINQVAEERLICLSSNFNYSLIKKRMIMMNSLKLAKRTRFKILAIIPLAAVLFLGVACIKGKDNANPVNAVELVRMNVLYIGIENPVKIAASGYESSELTVSIDNGTISGSNGEYTIKPKEIGSAVVTISSDGKEIHKTQFRVKSVPDPVAALKTVQGNTVNHFTGGTISKKDLLSAGGIEAVLFNFDFDLSFSIASFVMSATLPNSNIVVEEISNSGKYSEAQLNLINSLVKYQKLMFEEVIAIGPDGVKRKLNPMVFTISGD